MNDPVNGVSRAVQDVGASLDAVTVSADRVAATLTNAFTRAVSSGQAFDKTLQSVLGNLSKMALNAATPPLQQGLAALFSSVVGGAGARITPFAQGGVVAQPTFFASGGGAGLMGWHGAEAIMPLARWPDGRLGVAATAPSAALNVTVNIAASDVESFRRSQVQISSALARAVARGQRGL
jgi:lambda family phage tail tape measure protein